MRKILFLNILLLVLAGCKSKKITADSSDKFVIENLARISSAEDLSRIYPDASVEEGTDLFEEGIVKRPYTILFPGTPDEALITWNNPERTQLNRIRVENDGRWKTSNGIEIGTTYKELEEINKGSIEFYGFGWDYSGAVDWNGGRLSGSNIRVFLEPKETPPNKFYGDRKIEASEEEIEALELTVQAILFQADE